jgi:hypothetical protein
MSAGDDDVLTVIATAFDSARLPYALIGGHAVNVWLEPRFTADLPDLDWPYVEERPREWDVLDRLARLRAPA